jgi:formylglycine-generating enzyme required for sulfatase activity
VDADIHPHLWSGTNSASAREKAAEALKNLVNRLSRSYSSVHVVGHSHGGNVANDAACMLNWSGRQRRPKLASITTVGAPFFRTHITAGERLGAWAFIIMAILSIVAMIGIALYVIPRWASTQSEIEYYQHWLEAGPRLLRDPSFANRPQEEQDHVRGYVAQVQTSDLPAAQRRLRQMQLLGFAGLAGLTGLVFMIPLALRGVARITRAGRRARTDASIFSIWHPQDEAIAFLHRVETLPLEPFPRWSLMRGSRTGAIVWGVRAVIVAPLIGAVVLAESAVLSILGAPETYYSPWGEFSPLALGWSLLLYGTASAPLLFAGVYLLYRLIATTAFEFSLRNTLNRMVANSLRGLAFGRDNDNRIGDVAPASHYFATRSLVLGADVAQRMSAAASKSAQRLFDKYRAGFFSVEADQSESIRELAADALTWDSLVHTTYFDQPELSDEIGAHIAGIALQREGQITPQGGVAANSPHDGGRGQLFRQMAHAVPSVLLFASGIGAALVVVGLSWMHAMARLNHDELAGIGVAEIVSPPFPLRHGQALRDCPECPELLVLSGATFSMGSPTTEAGRLTFELPLRRVTVEPFAVGKYEVTFAQWEACVRGGGCSAQSNAGPGSEHPVTNVDWNDAQDYVRWLSRETGRQYRLLSTAEWEFAARAQLAPGVAQTRFSWGDDDPQCQTDAPSGAAFNCSQDGTWPVGSFLANAFGLHDMHGNVVEWVQDCLPGSRHCSIRELRGGSWDDDDPGALRSALRSGDLPHLRDDSRGLRIARTL